MSSKHIAQPPQPANGDALTDVLQFMRLLWALAHALDRTSKHMSTQLGVTGPQRLVLRVVGLQPGVSAGDLAAVLHVHPSTLTGILQRLIGQKLLARTLHPEDGRRAVLRLTRRGGQINARTKGTVEGAITRALSEVTPADRDACCRVLEQVTGCLDPLSIGARESKRRSGR